MPTFSPQTWQRVSLAVIALGMALSFTAVMRKSVTVDEFQAMPSGLAMLETGDFRYPLGTPPLSQILPALPVWIAGARVPPMVGPTANWAEGHTFAATYAKDFHFYFFLARVVSLFALLATMLLAYGLARRVYGAPAAAITAACVAFNPTLLAHGALVTPDIYLACAFTAFLYLLDVYLVKPSLHGAAILGAVIGLACLTKFTGLLLFPFLPLFLGLRRWRHCLLAFAVALFTINAGYLFQEVFASSSTLALRSSLRLIPEHLPLPAQFLRAIDSQLTETAYPAFLLGEYNVHGFFSYYAVALLVKSPAGLLLLIALASLSRISARERPLLILSIFYFGFFSLARYKNLGVRYLLFLYPWAATWCARIRWSHKIVRTLAGAALLSMVIGSALTWPNFLAYFNLPSGGPDYGHRYLLDSNLDWGQDLTTLKDFMDEQSIPTISLAHFGHVDPALYGIHYSLLNGMPQSQWVAISANFLWGRAYYVNGSMFYPEHTAGYEFFQTIKPRAVLGHSIYIFNTGDIPRQKK
ncbi:MAG: ArnT family glycosyltransferase [Bdellovibrionota bacterium]